MLHTSFHNNKKKKNEGRKGSKDELRVLNDVAKGQSEFISSWGSILNILVSKCWLRPFFFLGTDNT